MNPQMFAMPHSENPFYIGSIISYLVKVQFITAVSIPNLRYIPCNYLCVGTSVVPAGPYQGGLGRYANCINNFTLLHILLL